MQLIRETCIETYKEECEINPNFKMVYESMQAYRETATTTATGPATTASASTAANERLFNTDERVYERGVNF